MNEPHQDFTHLGFARTFIVPALLIFLVPVLGWMFFRHAQSRNDEQTRVSALQSIRDDSTLTEDERAELIEVYETVPVSEMMKVPEYAEQMPRRVRFDYLTFRWAIRLSALSVIGSLLIFALIAGGTILASRVTSLQYVNLAVGWQVLRGWGAIQTIVQGALLVALSYWVTVLWMEMFVPKIILAVGIVAIIAAFAVIKAIFSRPNMDFEVQGEVVTREESPRLWAELDKLSQDIGTAPPDQVIIGIDDNFFVTGSPVKVGDLVLAGRTLFVSLSLLKQFDGEESRTVLAHEMAHFSGNDTVYSSRVVPLFWKYDNYLATLQQGGVTLPVFYYMVCFRVLYELSQGHHSRRREYRADRIAAELTSPESAAHALLRSTAYSTYRAEIEQELFQKDRLLELADVNVAERIATGFPGFAESFGSETDLKTLSVSHPFDSHPSTFKRCAELGIELNPEQANAALSQQGDGAWFGLIDNAEEREQTLWRQFEQQFRDFHEQVLAYRFLPETDEERAIVEKFFPNVEFSGKYGTLKLCHSGVQQEKWDHPFLFEEISNCYVDDSVLKLICELENRTRQRAIPLKEYPVSDREQILNQFGEYYGRHQTAVTYAAEKQRESEESTC